MSDAVMVPRVPDPNITAVIASMVRRMAIPTSIDPDAIYFDNGHARKIYAAIVAASTPVGGWEDISTAPKDGSAFLIAYDNGSVRAGYYLDNSHTPFPWKGVRPAHGTEPVTAKITHWMPLPPPPSVSIDNGSLQAEDRPSVPTEQTAPPVVAHMVQQFLGWRLPEDFNPDNGISFKPTFNDHMGPPMRCNPTGTNLFDARQAEAMVRHLLEGLPK